MMLSKVEMVLHVLVTSNLFDLEFSEGTETLTNSILVQSSINLPL